MLDYTCSGVDATVGENTEFWVSFVGEPGVTVKKFEAKIYFDGDNLGVLAVAGGSLISALRHKVDFSVLSDQTSYLLDATVTLTSQAVIGTGELFKVKFEALNAGTYTLDFDSLKIYYDATYGYAETHGCNVWVIS